MQDPRVQILIWLVVGTSYWKRVCMSLLILFERHVSKVYFNGTKCIEKINTWICWMQWLVKLEPQTWVFKYSINGDIHMMTSTSREADGGGGVGGGGGGVAGGGWGGGGGGGGGGVAGWGWWVLGKAKVRCYRT